MDNVSIRHKARDHELGHYIMPLLCTKKLYFSTEVSKMSLRRVRVLVAAKTVI